jgi:hypothetical protein
MKIQELADLLGTQLIVVYYPNQDNRWCCHLDGVDIADGVCLISAWENGKTPEEAIENYLVRIAGKTIKYKDMYFTVPALSY